MVSGPACYKVAGLKESTMEMSHLKSQDLKSCRRPPPPPPGLFSSTLARVRLLLGPVRLRH